ncbi:hypothetical protein ACFFQW_31965 [Umezawaea endophytica]|uniref:Uncharacterized protein n=1 Tax=Umezawaea endophytica TaxID=1654476 RepID=A0A9X2VQ58_9PSEU|nr:hypothetical protein [Umezawaea endophytica]MCS7480680.1 hypothetical protein [Umezawaea endophytica]
MDTDTESARVAALAALIGWADRRERLSSDRADLVAEAWRTGTRNVAELARLARVSRDTVYADLASRDVTVGKRQVEPTGSLAGRGAPLRADSVRAVGQIADAVVRPAFGHDPADPVTRAAFSASGALEVVADVLDPPTDQGPGWTRPELLRSLAERGDEVTHHALRALAASGERARLAADADLRRRSVLHTGRHAVVDGADIALTTPTGETVTVRVGADDTGWTTLDGPLLAGEVEPLDHLEVRAALDVLARVATRHLVEGAKTERRKDALPGSPPPRHRFTPSNE